MPRLPISSKAPPSPSDANEAAMKSSERLLSTACKRVASKRRVAPIVRAVPSRELHMASTPIARSWPCLCGCPAVPASKALSHRTYSTALSPTPPAAAWTIIELPVQSPARSMAACVVLHVTGSEHTRSKDSVEGLAARKGAAAIATDASGAWARPKVEGGSDCASFTTPAASPPGGPGSPGYSPSTLSTSRKLRPTARTRKSTSAPVS